MDTLCIIFILVAIILYHSYISTQTKEGFIMKKLGPFGRPYWRKWSSSIKSYFKNITSKFGKYKRKIGL